MNRRGFTLIEVLTVVSIIAILAALLVVGVGKLQTTAKRRQTEQVLANCQAMFGDWEAYSRQTFSREPMACPNNVTPALALQNMGSYVYDSITPYHRFGDAVLFTQDVMYHLNTMPTNAAALAKLPQDSKTTVPTTVYTGGTSPNASFASFDTTGATAYSAYPPSTNTYKWRVSTPATAYSLLTYYDCVQSTQSGSVTAITDPAYWLSGVPISTGNNAPAQVIPIPLDGWGNPIIFVPYELGSYGPSTTPTSTRYPVGPTGALVAGGICNQPKSPDSRPFFASAGPDGDFSLGDDNLYSFEH